MCVCVCARAHPGYSAGLWDNCQYNVSENITMETCTDRRTRKYCHLFIGIETCVTHRELFQNGQPPFTKSSMQYQLILVLLAILTVQMARQTLVQEFRG